MATPSGRDLHVCGRACPGHAWDYVAARRSLHPPASPCPSCPAPFHTGLVNSTRAISTTTPPHIPIEHCLHTSLHAPLMPPAHSAPLVGEPLYQLPPSTPCSIATSSCSHQRRRRAASCNVCGRVETAAARARPCSCSWRGIAPSLDPRAAPLHPQNGGQCWLPRAKPAPRERACTGLARRTHVPHPHLQAPRRRGAA